MNDDLDEIFKQYYADNLTLQEEYLQFAIHCKDMLASINQNVYIEEINENIPIWLLNIMIERMNELSKCRVSNYSKYRACEDYLTKTEWFFNLSSSKQFEIRFDFYKSIVMGIRNAFYR